MVVIVVVVVVVVLGEEVLFDDINGGLGGGFVCGHGGVVVGPDADEGEIHFDEWDEDFGVEEGHPFEDVGVFLSCPAEEGGLFVVGGYCNLCWSSWVW